MAKEKSNGYGLSLDIHLKRFDSLGSGKLEELILLIEFLFIFAIKPSWKQLFFNVIIFVYRQLSLFV